MSTLKGPLISLFSVLALVLALAACEEGFFGTGEKGSGNLVTEVREVDSFDRIDVGSAINLDVVVDASVEQSVTVTYDDNLLDNLITRVQGGELALDFDGNVNLTGAANRVIEVITPELVALDASGATDVAVRGSESNLVIDASGASSVTVSGSAENVELDVSGASDVDLTDLSVADVALDVSGASTVTVDATGVISGEASGASTVEVRGDPASVLVETSGASSIDLP